MNWELSEGIVLKSRGLTGGKGVTVCEGKQEALEAITRYNKKYGRHILIAERLVGEEFSVFGISDGNRVVPLEISVQDHKRLNDNDQGPNTGGMGAYCPAPVASAEVVRNISDRILTPVVREMADRGTPYRGFLYAGMMMTKEGPKVLEFNVRFGDPECQPAMMLLKSDLYKVLTAALDGKLDQVRLEFNTGAACCVVLAAPTYPHSGSKGLSISGIADAERMPGIKVFHAGTRREGDQVVTAGGRVLGVTAYSPAGIREARDRAYAAVERITVQKGFHYRTDIAGRALQR